MTTIRFEREETLFSDNRNIIIAGITGACKTNLAEHIATGHYGEYKIIAFTFKSEFCQAAFPETDRKLVSIMDNLFDREPAGYPHQVFIPFAKSPFKRFKKQEQKIKLPYSKDGNCTFEPFKIPMVTLAASDFISLLRRATETGNDILSFVLSSQRFKDIGSLLETLVSLNASKFDVGAKSLTIKTADGDSFATIGKRETFLSLISLVASLQKSGLICGNENPYALDLDKVMRDKKRITTFDFAGLDFRLSFLILVAILRQIISLRTGGKKKYSKICLVIPELHFIAPASRFISPLAVAGFSSLPLMQFLSSQGRILGIKLIADVQNPATCAYPVLQNFSWWVLTCMHRKSAAYIDENIVRLPKDVVFSIPKLRMGLCSVVKTGERRYWHPLEACPVKFYHRKPGQNVLGWVESQPGVELKEYVDLVGTGLKVEVKKRMAVISEQEKSKLALKLLGRNSIKDLIAAEIRGKWKTIEQMCNNLNKSRKQVTNGLYNLNTKTRGTGRGHEKEYLLVE